MTTESPFPFGGPQQAPAFEAEPEKDNRKTVLALGALAAVAVGAGAFLFLGGSGDEAVEDFTPVKRTAKPAAAAPAKPAPVKAVAKVPAPSNVPLGTNPFKALVLTPASGPAGGGAAAAPAKAPASSGGTPIVVSNGSGTGGTGGTTAPARSTVELLSVSTKTGAAVATFRLDGQEVSGKAGDVLAGKVLVRQVKKDVRGWHADLQVGDGTPFEVYLGQEVVVS